MNKNSLLISNIWNMCSSIRGSVSALDYPYVILPALLLKWAELKNKEEGFEKYKEIYAPSRLAVTYGTADKAEDVIRYLSDIEECQTGVVGGYISEFYRYIEMVPEKDFSTILEMVSKLDVKKSTDLYDIAKEALSFASNMFGKMPIVFSTTATKQIEKIALGEVSDNDKVFDGFSGFAVSTIEATDGKGQLTLCDINPLMAGVSETLCILKGVMAVINVENSLCTDEGKDSFDFAISEPPFGVRNVEYRDGEVSFFDSDMDNMYIKNVLSKICANGKGVVLSPSGALFRSGKSLVGRKELIENGNIETVIQLPPGAIQGTSISSAIIVLKKERFNKDILFVDATTMFEAVNKAKTDYVIKAGNVSILADIIASRKNVDKISKLVEVSEIENCDYSLVTTKYLSSDDEIQHEIDLIPLITKDEELRKHYNKIEEELSSVRRNLLTN